MGLEIIYRLYICFFCSKDSWIISVIKPHVGVWEYLLCRIALWWWWWRYGTGEECITWYRKWKCLSRNRLNELYVFRFSEDDQSWNTSW